jgi:hypothetical protein
MPGLERNWMKLTRLGVNGLNQERLHAKEFVIYGFLRSNINNIGG